MLQYGGCQGGLQLWVRGSVRGVPGEAGGWQGPSGCIIRDVGWVRGWVGGGLCC
jgi:hypothetical protein